VRHFGAISGVEVRSWDDGAGVVYVPPTAKTHLVSPDAAALLAIATAPDFDGTLSALALPFAEGSRPPDDELLAYTENLANGLVGAGLMYRRP
jgi:hypothetical protein